MLKRMNISAFYMNLQAIILFIGIMVLVSSADSCAGQKRNDRGRGEEMPGKKIEEVLKEHTPEWMSMPGVVGTAQGLCDGQPCIKIFAVEKTWDLEQKIPQTLEGYPVVIEETGKFRALPKRDDR